MQKDRLSGKERNMKKFVVTLIFNKERTHVLMEIHKKQGCLNFPGGKIKRGEDDITAAYRELLEETGIRRIQDVSLIDIEKRISWFSDSNCIDNEDEPVYLSFTAGVLFRDVELKPEKNELVWIDIKDLYTITTLGYNDNWATLRIAIEKLDIPYRAINLMEAVKEAAKNGFKETLTLCDKLKEATEKDRKRYPYDGSLLV